MTIEPPNLRTPRHVDGLGNSHHERAEVGRLERLTVKIRLSKGYFAIIDKDDREKVRKHRWHIMQNKSGIIYAAATVRENGRVWTLLLHRLITNAPAGMCVDHKNHDGLDNRKENLRVCTAQQNSANRKIKRLGLHGVSRCRGTFQARIAHNGITYHLGCFKNPSDAAVAYDRAAIRIHGEFAATNFQRHSAGADSVAVTEGMKPCR